MIRTLHIFSYALFIQMTWFAGFSTGQTIVSCIGNSVTEGGYPNNLQQLLGDT